jgi:hypothetical protein
MPGDRIVLLAAGASVRDDDSTTTCVRKSLEREKPDVRFVTPVEFRDAVRSFRWPFEGPEQDARSVMADPLVRDAVARLGVHYAIGVSTIKSTGRGSEGLHGGLGLMWGTEDRAVSAHIWDLKGAGVLGTMIVAASGKIIGVGLVPEAGLFSVVSFPIMTDTVACRALGRHLAKFLAAEKLSASPRL